MTHFVITKTTRNQDGDPLIGVYHNKDEALEEYTSMSRITHYYYKLTQIADGEKTPIRSEYYDRDALQWKDTSTLYE